MFDNIINFFKKFSKDTKKDSKDTAKERLHLVLMQDRANVSADFLEMMKQEIIEVIKKYIDVDENEIDVRLTNQENDDGSKGAPALYANIPIVNIKEEKQKTSNTDQNQTQPSNENTSNPDQNQTQQSNKNTLNTVGGGFHLDPNQTQSSTENTTNNQNNNPNQNM